MSALSTNGQFLKVYDEFADAIFRHCYFRIGNRERAKELMQETFMRTWQSLHKGKQIIQIKAFLYKVANNLIVDEFRKRKEASLEELAENGFEPGVHTESKLHAAVEGKKMLELLEQLEPGYREVLTMRYIDDLTPKEIAEVLEENENAISVRIHRGLAQVRKLLPHE